MNMRCEISGLCRKIMMIIKRMLEAILTRHKLSLLEQDCGSITFYLTDPNPNGDESTKNLFTYGNLRR